MSTLGPVQVQPMVSSKSNVFLFDSIGFGLTKIPQLKIHSGKEENSEYFLIPEVSFLEFSSLQINMCA